MLSAIVQNTLLSVILLLCLWRVLRQFAPNLARRLHLMAADSSPRSSTKSSAHADPSMANGCGSCGQGKNGHNCG
ncbi:MAG: hypothetical protein ORN98_06045 [Alphaproteobacteria bacterium]|nr:hypothetical protein [Alphaproteobacteria bacterium]